MSRRGCLVRQVCRVDSESGSTSGLARNRMIRRKMRVAMEALQSKADWVGLEHDDLLRQMLGATGDEKRDLKAAMGKTESLLIYGCIYC